MRVASVDIKLTLRYQTISEPSHAHVAGGATRPLRVTEPQRLREQRAHEAAARAHARLEAASKV